MAKGQKHGNREAKKPKAKAKKVAAIAGATVPPDRGFLAPTSVPKKKV